MSSIVEKSIKKPLLIIVIFIILTIGGALCYTLLNLNLLPNMEVPTMTVVTAYPGAGASEVETSVTKKVEDALSTLENLKSITSTSRENVSIIVVMLNEGTDIDKSVQNAQRKINAIRSDLPKDILDPSVDKISIDEIPILNVAISSSLPGTDFFNLIEDRIQPRLAKIEGIASIDIAGGNKREIKVNIDAEKLKSYNLSILQVQQAIQTANMEIPAGNIEDREATYSVRLAAKYSNLDDIRNTVIMNTPDGGSVKVKDVAEVEDGIADYQMINRIDALDAVGLSVVKQNDANAVKVAGEVKKELAAMEKEYASDNLKFTIANDTSVYTKSAANGVITDLILAIIIVAFVCFIFLHNIRSAIMIMIAVPLSIIPTFIVLYATGCSLNMMSLMALSLVVGILVDDSIVVIENMYHHMEMGKTKWRAALDGCSQLIFTVTAITLVLVVVFLPLLITGGIIGDILKEFAIPIVASVSFSLLVSFTVTPLLMSRFGKLSDETRPTLSARFSRMMEKLFNSLKDAYGRTLTKALKHKTVILLATAVLLAGSFCLLGYGFIGTEFTPKSDQNTFTVNLDMNPQVTLYQNNQITKQVEELLLGKPEIVRVYTNVGSTGSSIGNSSKNNATSISVEMVDRTQRNIDVFDYSEQIKNEIMQIPGVRARVKTGGTGSEPIQLVVQGADYNKIEEFATMLLDVVKNTPGTSDVRFSIDDPRQEVQIKLNRDRMQQMGLSSSDVGAALRLALAGNDDSKFSDGNFEFDIRISVDNFDRTKAEDISRLTILNKKGELIELGQIADISYGPGPAMLERTDRISSITVKSNVTGRSSGTVGDEILTAIDGKIPEGVTIKKGGMMEMQSDAFVNLALSFLAAIILIYLIMVVLYDSLIHPIVVLVSVPLSMIGALAALALTMNDLNIFSIIGLIVLIGLVTKNSILLVDFTNEGIRERGLSTFAALVEAGRERLRPILMTAFSTVMGMIPMAVAAGNGAEIKNGMAWVIIGGMLSSMLLTLFVVPVVYYIFDRIAAKSRRHKRNKLVEKVKEKWLLQETQMRA